MGKDEEGRTNNQLALIWLPLLLPEAATYIQTIAVAKKSY